MEMEMYTLDSGKTIKLMEKVFIFIKMDPVTPEIGLMIFNMDSEFKNGSMGQDIKGNF